MIQVSELHYSNEDGIKVLEDVHLHVDRGEWVALVGPPSSGKSLLLALLAALVPPQRGQILVHGRNVARLSRQKILDLQRRIGFYPQGFAPLPRTVLENLLFKLSLLGNDRERTREKAYVALEAVGMIREQATDADELSPGERVKLGLALAVCGSPLLLLLDDPFAGLDSAEQDEIASLIGRFHDGRATVVLATRDPLPRAAAGIRALYLADGTVVAR
ncbi:MAG: ATP-binding cassette domain-containing protein [Candidatus Bipolaricaulis sp.]|nr:ATP-binding cassette domain-containing protein [Candidatus Bipolaricaulis sp.]MDD5220593.1 ATP-binding cassette domain-containing protein [Candidatus Bipolaricaulis sp.]MDD5646103.1 ATP-binding cassette domain-containing protein [Candidatus Bipolaricaulis sp.]